MNRQALAVAALAAVLPTLSAQDDRKPPAQGDKPTTQQAPPNPKTKEHDVLRSFAGNWDVVYKMTPAGGQPMESKGTERAELVCNGLWVKSIISGEWEGKPYQGLWLLGYDPQAKSYHGVCVDTMEPSPVKSQGRYDEATKTFEFSGTGKDGPFKMTSVIKDPDTIVETGTCTHEGKECKVEITRKRGKGGMPMDASAAMAKAPSKEHEELLKTVGTWDAVMKAAMEPGAAPTEMKGSETVTAICDGHYVWSDFKMQWQGQPFEGHALCGYDTQQKKYVSFWIDSMSPALTESSGRLDASGKTLTLTGNSRDPSGKPTSITETITWKDDDTRHMKMECRGEKTESFEITYTRKGGSKGHGAAKGSEKGK